MPKPTSLYKSWDRENIMDKLSCAFFIKKIIFFSSCTIFKISIYICMKCILQWWSGILFLIKKCRKKEKNCRKNKLWARNNETATDIGRSWPLHNLLSIWAYGFANRTSDYNSDLIPEYRVITCSIPVPIYLCSLYPSSSCILVVFSLLYYRSYSFRSLYLTMCNHNILMIDVLNDEFKTHDVGQQHPLVVSSWR